MPPFEECKNRGQIGNPQKKDDLI